MFMAVEDDPKNRAAHEKKTVPSVSAVIAPATVPPPDSYRADFNITGEEAAAVDGVSDETRDALQRLGGKDRKKGTHDLSGVHKTRHAPPRPSLLANAVPSDAPAADPELEVLGEEEIDEVALQAPVVPRIPSVEDGSTPVSAISSPDIVAVSVPLLDEAALATLKKNIHGALEYYEKIGVDFDMFKRGIERTWLREKGKKARRLTDEEATQLYAMFIKRFTTGLAQILARGALKQSSTFGDFIRSTYDHVAEIFSADVITHWLGIIQSFTDQFPPLAEPGKMETLFDEALFASIER